MPGAFDIAVATTSVKVDDNGRGKFVVTVSNVSGVPQRGTLTIKPQAFDRTEAAPADWVRVEGDAMRDFAADQGESATHQYTIRIQVPAAGEPGIYGFAPFMLAEQIPDENSTAGPALAFEVPGGPEPPPTPKVPWWVVAVIVGAVVVVGALVAFLLLRDTGDRALAAPVQVAPADGSVFGHFPRTLTLRWQAVPGASGYTIEIDALGPCGSNWCADVGRTFRLHPGLTATNFTFDFVGAQPGRWRVWAVGASGEEGPKSAWWEFRFTR